MKTLIEVSKLTGLGYEGLKKRAQKGTLKAIKIGRTWVVSTKELNKLLITKPGVFDSGEPLMNLTQHINSIIKKEGKE